MNYASIADLKTYLGISVTTDDTLLGDLLEQATVAIETYTGRDFAVSVATSHYLDAVADVCGALLNLDGDLCAISSVTNGDSVSLTQNTHYVTEPRNETPYYALRMLSSSGYSWTYTTDPERAITVTGYWGWSKTPPKDIEFACIRLAGYYYRAKDSQVYDVQAYPEAGWITVPQGMPKDVERILAPYKVRL